MNRILALDFGRARIGAALSDELQALAHPLETIPADEQAPSRIAEIVREKKVDHVVAGLPRRMDGQIGAAATEVLQFVEKLQPPPQRTAHCEMQAKKLGTHAGTWTRSRRK